MDIQEVYKKYNYPSKQKIYALTKLEGVKATLNEVQQFLDKQHAQQIFSRKIKQKAGHIVSFQPDERFQMDLIKELLIYIKERKKIWLVPIIVVTCLLGVLIIAAQGSALAPLIYTLF